MENLKFEGELVKAYVNRFQFLRDREEDFGSLHDQAEESETIYFHGVPLYYLEQADAAVYLAAILSDADEKVLTIKPIKMTLKYIWSQLQPRIV